MTNDDKAGWIAFVIAALVVALCVLAMCGCDAAEAEAIDVRRTGMPLDALSYDPPVWMDGCTSARKIVDRNTGDSWWLLTIGEGVYIDYVVLPISGGDW